ncbi:MAG TPA: response regulator transcription factor [Actinomycetota bacterium]|jgi:DNA-binding NarL/FixJ family response regulator|nr:response regulator transcription factor [Actinomycetota bacterium]
MSPRVLVVDDTEHVRTMLVDILKLYGFDVVGEAASGAQAVTVANDMRPDIIVMDYKMPGQDGVEATREIRSSIPDQRVILYSAFLSRELQEQARDAGVAVCVPKGSGVESLAAEISALVMDLGDEGETAR